MNEQLRKAIEEATRVETGLQSNVGTDRIKNYVPEDEHDASQAKLLRVIELLVEQRNKFADCCDRLMPFDEAIQPFDAELIAALEGK